MHHSSLQSHKAVIIAVGYAANGNVCRDYLKLFPPITGSRKTVRQGIPDRRTSLTESPSVSLAYSGLKYTDLLVSCILHDTAYPSVRLENRVYEIPPPPIKAERLPRCDTCNWLTQFHEVRRRLTVQAVEHHEALILVLSALGLLCWKILDPPLDIRVRQNKKPHCTKCIIVPVVHNFPAKFSGTVPGIIYRLQY